MIMPLNYRFVPLSRLAAALQELQSEKRGRAREADESANTIEALERQLAVARHQAYVEQARAAHFNAIVTEQRAQLTDMDELVCERDRIIRELRQDIMALESRVQAERSVPKWTRHGSRWVRLNEGQNPISDNDPLLNQISRKAAQFLAKELYQMAKTEPAARLLVTRSQPVIDMLP